MRQRLHPDRVPHAAGEAETTAAIAIECLAASRKLNPAARLAAFRYDDLVSRETMGYTRLQLAEQYLTLVCEAGVQGRDLWDHGEEDAAYRHWRVYLDEQAAIDGFKLEHTFWLQTSFSEPLTLIARPNGRPYKLALKPEKRVKAVERDYGRERVRAAQARADKVLRARGQEQ